MNLNFPPPNLDSIQPGAMAPSPHHQQDAAASSGLTCISVTSVNINGRLQEITKKLLDTPESKIRDKVIKACLRPYKGILTEEIERCLCNLFDMDIPLICLQSKTRDQLLGRLRKLTLFSNHYNTHIEALHLLGGPLDQRTLYDFPLDLQREFYDELKRRSFVKEDGIQRIFASPIYSRSLTVTQAPDCPFELSFYDYMNPIVFAFEYGSDHLADGFLNHDVSLASVKIHRLSIDKQIIILKRHKFEKGEKEKLLETLIRKAIQDENAKNVDKLLAIQKLNPELSSALMIMLVQQQKDQIIEVFCKNGYQFTADYTPLEYAVRENNYNRVSELLDSDMHGQRDPALINKALEFAFSRKENLNFLTQLVNTLNEVWNPDAAYDSNKIIAILKEYCV